MVFVCLFVLFLEREEGRKERNIHVWENHWLVASCIPQTRDLACNPGMCPDWESNLQPFSLWDYASPLSHTSQGSYRVIGNVLGILYMCWLIISHINPIR